MLERDAQKRLSRHPRGHRVPIFLDVDDKGGTPKEQIPFVVAILAELSGDAPKAANKWAQEVGQEINRNNFEAVLAKIHPQLSFSVKSKLSNSKENDTLPVNLTFKNSHDFEPTGIAENVGPLRARLALRQRLRELLGQLRTDPELRKELQRVIQSQESRKQISSAVAGLLNAAPVAQDNPPAN